MDLSAPGAVPADVNYVGFDTTVTANNSTVRFMVDDTYARTLGVDFKGLTLLVEDSSIPKQQARVVIYPVSLRFEFSGSTTKDRLVHLYDPVNDPQYATRDRVLQFRAAGQVAAYGVKVKAWEASRNAGQELGMGRLDVLSYDGQASVVAPGGTCDHSPLARAPFGDWEIQTGVTASWDPANNDFGTLHDIEIRGDATSSWYEDIEVDLVVEQGSNAAAQVKCYDGIGAHIDYTVIEYSIWVGWLAKSKFLSPGLYLPRAKGDTAGAEADYVVSTVEPLDGIDAAGFTMHSEVLAQDAAGEWTVPYGIFEFLENDSAVGSSVDKAVNVGLEAVMEIRPAGSTPSVDARDALVRAEIRDGTIEVGDETTRHELAATHYEYDVVNPLPLAIPELDDPITEAASAGLWGKVGNEFTFSAAATGRLEIHARVAVLPDTAAIQSDLVDKLDWGVDALAGSALSWRTPVPALPAGTSKAQYDATHQEWSTVARYDGLPNHNSEFGLHQVTLRFMQPGMTSVAWRLDSYDVEYFFTAQATGGAIVSNHPGGTGTANFFHYYRHALGDDSAAYGYDGTLDTSRTHPSGGGDAAVTIAPNAYTGDTYIITSINPVAPFNLLMSLTGGVPDRSVTYYHLQYFTGVVAHERAHANPAIMAELDITTTSSDTDRDEILNVAEDPAVTNTLPTGMYSSGGSAATYDDDEVYCGGPVEAGAILGADLSKDWARPGWNFDGK